MEKREHGKRMKAVLSGVLWSLYVGSLVLIQWRIVGLYSISCNRRHPAVNAYSEKLPVYCVLAASIWIMDVKCLDI
jgi:hypothetical protein